jgi:hypothetical protein
MKNGVFWDVTPLAPVRKDVSEELSASFTMLTRIGELGTTLAVTSKQKQTPWSLVRERTIPTERPPVTSKQKQKQTPWSLVRERPIPTERPPRDEI